MRDELDRAAGVTYIGPRSFVIGFAIVCGAFLAVLFSASKLIQSSDFAAIPGTGATALISATGDPSVGSAPSTSRTFNADGRANPSPVVARQLIRAGYAVTPDPGSAGAAALGLAAPAPSAPEPSAPKMSAPHETEPTGAAAPKRLPTHVEPRARSTSTSSYAQAGPRSALALATRSTPVTSEPSLRSRLTPGLKGRAIRGIKARAAVGTQRPLVVETSAPPHAKRTPGMFIPLKNAPGLTFASALDPRPAAHEPILVSPAPH